MRIRIHITESPVCLRTHFIIILREGVCDRNQDYTYFCRAAIEKYRAEDFPIWIVSDARYGTWGLGEMLEVENAYWRRRGRS